jgi:hypothetical protein
MDERKWASYPTFMPAYVRGLIESTAAAHPPSPRSTLRDRFVAWYDDLPAVSRDRPFSMVEFERALKTQGRHLSPILLSLGWKRKRRWASGGGQYNRYWVPPALSD